MEGPTGNHINTSFLSFKVKVRGDRAGRSNAAFTVATILLFLISGILFVPDIINGEGLVITDSTDDVIRTGYVDVKIGGYDEIDISSLKSTETISDMTITMTCVDDITDEIGYLYTISVSGIHIALQEGAFEVWRLGGEVQSVDNVQTGYSNNEITVVVMKTSIVGDVIINGTTNFDTVDWTKGSTTESYYDLVGEIDDRTRAPGPGDYTFNIDDDEGDVRLIYLDEEPEEEAGLDIVSLSITQGANVRLDLLLDDTPIRDDQVTYTIFLGKDRVEWSNGEAFHFSDDESRSSVGSTVSDETIEITIPEDDLQDELGGIIVRARWDVDESTFIQDLLPDDPYSISELLPFPPGQRREIKLEMISPEEVIMKRTYSGFLPQSREDIRSSIDTNDDDEVVDQEIDEFISGIMDDISTSDHQGDLEMDGKEGEMELDIQYSGLKGPVDSSTSIEISFIQIFTFDLSDKWDLSYDVEIEFIDPVIVPPLMIEENDLEYLIYINISGDWEIDPLSLEPAELSNHLSAGGMEIELLLSGERAREFDPGSLSFGIRVPIGVGDDDDNAASSGNDLTWLYVLILVVMLVVMGGVFLWYRRED